LGVIRLRFEEFLGKLVLVTYNKDRRIVGDLTKVDDKFIVIQTLSQSIYINLEEIITLQPARKEEGPL